MGFLDKVKAQAEQTLKQGQEKIDEVQAKRRADGLLRDLGAWYYAVQTSRDDGEGEGELARLIAELKAHEAEHGPLDRRDDDEADPPPGGQAATVPPSGSPPPAPPDGGSPPPASPPPVGMPPGPLPPVGAPPMPAAPPVPPPSSAPRSPVDGGPALDGP